MGEEAFFGVMERSIWVTVQVLAPLLLISSAIGLLVGLFQTVTQINEMTLTFIPKIVVVALVILFLGPWMLHMMMDFSSDLILSIPDLIRS
ncbi:MAG TPA: flagellar biosynthesis protein FliQ [Candidatus Obscuribacterales bacterium]